MILAMAEGCNAKGKDTSQPDKKEACYKSSANRDKGLNWVVAMITKQNITETRNVIY